MTLLEIILDLYYWLTNTRAQEYGTECSPAATIIRWRETEYFSAPSVNSKKFTFKGEKELC